MSTQYARERVTSTYRIVLRTKHLDFILRNGFQHPTHIQVLLRRWLEKTVKPDWKIRLRWGTIVRIDEDNFFDGLLEDLVHRIPSFAVLATEQRIGFDARDMESFGTLALGTLDRRAVSLGPCLRAQGTFLKMVSMGWMQVHREKLTNPHRSLGTPSTPKTIFSIVISAAA